MSKILISVSNAGESYDSMAVLEQGIWCRNLAVKHPSSQSALCDYFVGRGDVYWKNFEGATLATYQSYRLLANYPYVDDEVNVVSEDGEERTLPWYEVQKAICDKLNTSEGLVGTVADLVYQVEDNEVHDIGDGDHTYKTRDQFLQDINWEQLANSSKSCWLLVCMNSK